MDSALLDAFNDAQRQGHRLLAEVVTRLETGMTEWDLSEIARERARDLGFNKWFHPPEIEFGGRTQSNAVWKLPSKRNRLKPGDLVVIDLGPGNDDVYADVGITIAHEAEEPEVVRVARECVRATAGYGSQWKTVGELFVYAQAFATNHRMTLASSRSIGHAILPKTPRIAWDFPRSAHACTWLRRHQIRFLNPRRLSGLWALRPLVSDGTQGASFEEVIYVDGNDKLILGRGDLSEVGTLLVG
jgi:hypothetical protein